MPLEYKDPPRDNRDHMIAVRLNDRERGIVEAIAAIQEVSVSAVLRAAINGPLFDELAELRPDLVEVVTEGASA